MHWVGGLDEVSGNGGHPGSGKVKCESKARVQMKIREKVTLLSRPLENDI